MPSPLRFQNQIFALMISVAMISSVAAQMGGMGGGGMPGGGGFDKPKFREKVLQEGGPRLRNDETDRLIIEVRIEGLQVVPENRVHSKLQTRVDRNYSPETVMEDVRRLYSMDYFERVTHKVEDRPEGVVITFIVRERPLVKEVVFLGHRAMNLKELNGRAGIEPGDPLSDTGIEAARRKLIEYYKEEGFSDVTIRTVKGTPEHPRAVLFVINEGELIRVKEVHIHGSSFIDEARLKKIVAARGNWTPLNVIGLKRYFGNSVAENLFDDDKDKLELYYRNLGFFDARVGRYVDYDETGKWMTVNYVVNEGIRYEVTDIQIMGTKYIKSESFREHLKLLPGYPFDRSKMDADVRFMLDAYGAEGFFFADIQAQPTLLDEHGKLAMIYKVQEGDRCKCGPIRIHINGDVSHTKLGPVLNRLDGVRPGQLLNRTEVDQAERRLKASGLFIVNPAEGDPPRIEVGTSKFDNQDANWN